MVKASVNLVKVRFCHCGRMLVGIYRLELRVVASHSMQQLLSHSLRWLSTFPTIQQPHAVRSLTRHSDIMPVMMPALPGCSRD
jgi:hypothetical protein